jgi:oxygen-independent coproporphyrinogen-3 oxidase
VYSGVRVSERASSALEDQTEVGSYFVATYPPFSTWTAEAVTADGRPALEAPPVPGVPLGLYLHIPFCRKR